MAKLAGDRWSGHTEVELALLNHDARTVAAEVPLWLDSGEHELMRLVKEPGPLTGHIDILRVENGKVWVWDYKPEASKERFAATQTLAYAVMLSQRTGLPLRRFRCGWFDEKEAFVFEPRRMRGFR
jgi:ATP-dependent exoDNAse (exonuclease V) beta subunit